MLKDIDKYTKEQLENMCKRCGICCHNKMIINERVHIFINNPCKYLNEKEECRVYEERFKKKDIKCMTLEEAIKAGILPKECGYKELFPENYNYPKIVRDLRDISGILR